MIETPEIVNHHTYVIQVYKRTATDKWFATASRDAMQIRLTADMASEGLALHAVLLSLIPESS